MEVDITSNKRRRREDEKLTVRSPADNYIAAGFVVLFFSALLARLEFDRTAEVIALVAIPAIITLALTDRLVIDRRRIVRNAVFPYLGSMITGRSLRLKFGSIEQIETFSIERFKRGTRVYYSYRTIVRGGNSEFTFHSNRRSYGRAIAAIFSNVNDDVMDNRSLELRDYFADRRHVGERLRASEIPGGDVLEGTLRNRRLAAIKSGETHNVGTPVDFARFESLRRLANELRIAGFLVPSLEAFRRALLLQPGNGWLLFEFGRSILAYAASEGNVEMERKGFAMMRLAERRAGIDVALLSRLGESYFHAGYWSRASVAFRKSTETVGANFRAVRGQAEIALREGKLAHVVHNFSVANALARVRSLRRWTNGEIEYFTRLNADNEYMELEISRLNLTDTFHRMGKWALPTAAAGGTLILVGSVIDENTLADVGWAISTAAIVCGVVARLGGGIVASRIPPQMIDK